jgi:glutamate N-acetyltransferase/amino-acid N-acetyltransferase
MASTNLRIASVVEHRAWLSSQAALPKGFRVGTTSFDFVPVEVTKGAKMTVTLIVLDEPTPAFAACFTKNAFPGAPVIIGRKRLEEPTLGALVVNNKIANVCAPSGVEASERLCAAVAQALKIQPGQVMPSSTGVIGWQLPVDAMIARIPTAVATLQKDSVLPAAEGILTTDLFPKVRRAAVGDGAIVGIAKGAGMIEPNLATMLVYLLTDCDVPREFLREALAGAVNGSFNNISIDSDTSTSDTVAALSSRRVPCPDPKAFRAALDRVCGELAEDVVRNGEGVHHVIRVAVGNAPTVDLARGIGKSIINSPLFQCAVCGNDPNVGRLVCAIGKFIGGASHLGAGAAGIDLTRCVLTLGGQTIFADGVFRLDPAKEKLLVAHLKDAQLYASKPAIDGFTFKPPLRYPAHERCVEITVDLGLGGASCTVLGGDRSHEYISENADYRS